MHAAGATGAAVVLADCSSDTRSVAFYGAACVGGTCGEVADAGSDGRLVADAAVSDGDMVYDGNTTVFYGAPCLDACGVQPEDSGQAETSLDAGDEASDAGTGDAADGD
jgi:hypothetical protein